MDKQIFNVPTGDELKTLRKKFNQDEEKLEHNLSLFLDWLFYQKYLHQDDDRNFLRNFIFSCKNDLHKAKKKFIIYKYSPFIYKEFISDRIITPEEDLRTLDFSHIIILPNLTPEGRRISVFKPFDLDALELITAARYTLLLSDFLLQKDNFVGDLIAIFDMEFIKPHHYSKIFTPTIFRVIKLFFHVYPLRVNKIIIISCDSYLEKGINICKTFGPQKVASRVIMFKDYTHLQKIIPASCLPSDYGGSLKSLKELACGWRELLIKNEEFFKILSTKVPIGPIPEEFTLDGDEFGVDGSFRKLNID